MAHALLTMSMLGLPVVAQQVALTEAWQTEFRASAAFRDFQDEVGGEWRVDCCAATATPKAIWGTGIPLADWRANSLDEARRHAQQLLTERSGLLGLGTSEFREAIADRMGSTWVLVYDQYFRGLPVIGGRADVRINMAGRIPMFGSRAFAIDSDFATTPSLSEETALPATFQTGANNRAAMSLSSNAPNAGSNLVFTTVDYAPAAPIGIQVLSLSQFHPGIDLGPVGMPGCSKFTGSEVTGAVLPVNGQSTYTLPIPSAGVFFGLAIHSQTFALHPGANAIGLVASNGVRAVIGL